MTNSNYAVFFYETFEEERQAIQKYLPNHITAGFTDKTVHESSHSIPPSAIISVRTQSHIPASWAPNLTAILTRSAGYNHLIAYNKKISSKLKYGYLPLYCSRAVAEQAMMLWMALLRKLPVQTQQFHQFNRDGLTGYECAEKNLLVVGVGNIGYEIVKIGRGLAMQVNAVELVEKYKDVHYLSLEKGLANADIIVAAMNLTDENRGYFNMELFKKVKPGAVFINIARGELSPLADLKEALNKGLLSGVALDVFADEGVLGANLRGAENFHYQDYEILQNLKKRSNVILTPHNAFNTAESVQRKSKQSIEQIDALISNGEFLWPAPVEG
jgi:D-lactate dehydrogenase